ncbi:inner-membrane translocator [Acidovorax delafieldii 2AN]|uniref:Inner-membrane translocator n=1 Tax=Acidovorax delafieldii 2AN TaxID=573060 RepID=C5T0A5_ACIDE|nr:branched-chain amino acid ABC transporter permease [Acidovorax delafieldii]EER62058.1 inner-membrane translocator [Acidovorax delafieldii 2AN]
MKHHLLIRQRPVLVLLALVIAGTLLSWGRPFWLDNSVMIGIFALMALSVGLCYGQAGILSMATAAFASIGAFGSAILSTRYGFSPWLGLPFAMIVPMLVAYPLARALTRLSPLPLSIATFLLSGLFEIAIREGGDFTGGYIGLSGIPPLPLVKGVQQMHFLVWGGVLVVVALYANLMGSTYGLAINTARHDPLRATADGVGVPHLLANTFAASAALAGLAGWLYAHHMSYMGPDSLTTQVSISVLLMAVVGGAGTLLGPVAGAAALMLVTLYLPATESHGMVYGGILLVVLMLAPGGLLGTRWRSKQRAPESRLPVAEMRTVPGGTP